MLQRGCPIIKETRENRREEMELSRVSTPKNYNLNEASTDPTQTLV